MQKKFTKIFLVVVFSILTQVCWADPITDIYQVDIVVFEHLESNRFKSEHWPNFVGKIESKQAINLNGLKNNAPESIETMDVLDALDEAGDKPLNKVIQDSINLVDAKHLQLNHEVSTIKASKNQRLIKYIAWNQPMAANLKSTPIYFTVGSGNEPELSALITVKPARNMFSVNVDMIYKLQADDKKLEANVDEIRLTRDVKVRRRDLYYLDHPVLGVFIMITPVVLDQI